MSVLILDPDLRAASCIWDQYFYDYTTIEQKRVGGARPCHRGDRLIICVWIVHVYAAIWVRGTISAMTRGQVTGGWAWRHHRKWLRELVSRQERDDRKRGSRSRAE